MNDLYVLGGIDDNGVVNTVERAVIDDARGVFETFSLVPGVSLTTPRFWNTSMLIEPGPGFGAGGDDPGYLFMIGGNGQATTALANVEYATVALDGSLGPFVPADGSPVGPAPDLVTGRSQASGASACTNCLATTSSFYVIGGSDSGGSALGGAEHTVGYLPDPRTGAAGTLAFATLTNVALVTPRWGHTSIEVSNSNLGSHYDYVYVFGGTSNNNGGLLDTVERAAVNADGSLGPFVTVPGVTLATAREGHTSVKVGGVIYVIGGYGIDPTTGHSGKPLSTVEATTINSDGSLSPFRTLSSRLITARGGHTTEAVDVSVDLDGVWHGSVYVIGGGGGSAGILNSIERAFIKADGSLGAFEIVGG